jgi:hypothetical protein
MRLRPIAILLPSCLGAILGPPFAIGAFTVAFLVGAYGFSQVFLAFAGVYLVSLFFGLLGWIAGAYLPTLLSFWLSTEHRLTHWAGAFLLVTLYGAVVLSLIRVAFRIFRPTIAGLLFQIIPQVGP